MTRPMTDPKPPVQPLEWHRSRPMLKPLALAACLMVVGCCDSSPAYIQGLKDGVRLARLEVLESIAIPPTWDCPNNDVLLLKVGDSVLVVSVRCSDGRRRRFVPEAP